MHSVMIPNEGIDFNIKEEEIAEVLDDDEAPTSSRTLKQIKEESYDLQDVKREEFIEETYEELQEKYKKLKEESNGKINDQLAKTKLEHLKKMREKKIQERWIRALMHFGVDPKLYIEDKAKVMRIYPFNDFNFIKAKKGEYTKQKMAQVVLELCKFEVINDTYNVECKVSLIKLDYRISQEKQCKALFI